MFVFAILLALSFKVQPTKVRDPNTYDELVDILNKANTNMLPKHRAYDCPIIDKQVKRINKEQFIIYCL